MNTIEILVTCLALSLDCFVVMMAQGRQIEIIRLNGSIELAPILGLSDVIVDIVETGTTLKENDLGVFADVAQSSARLIANKASYQFSAGVIDGICGKLREKL